MRHTMINLTLENGELIVKTPYNREFVDDLKSAIPLHGRQWNPQRKVWIVAYIYGQDVVDCIARSFNTKIAVPPQKTSTKPTPVVKLLKIEYIGVAKKRGDGLITAMGYCEGQWSVVLSLKCLREWFEGNGDTPLNPNIAPSLYAILGVNCKATGKEIKTAYRIAARTWHPDINNDPDAPEQFRRVDGAYKTLREPMQRRKYDAGLYLQAQAEKQSINSNNFSTITSLWLPPKRCGWLTLEGEESLGRFVIKHIIQWDDIIEGGMTMISFWPKGGNAFESDWI